MSDLGLSSGSRSWRPVLGALGLKQIRELGVRQGYSLGRQGRAMVWEWLLQVKPWAA